MESFSGEVYSLLPAGPEVIIQVKNGNLIFNIQKMGEASFRMGEKVDLHLPLESMVFYDRETGLRIYPPGDR